MLGGPVAMMLCPPPVTFYSGQLVKAVQNRMQEHCRAPGVCFTSCEFQREQANSQKSYSRPVREGDPLRLLSRSANMKSIGSHSESVL